MPREALQEKAALTDRHSHVSILDPADPENFDRLHKRKIREKEEALMLAVLADAVECFQKYVLAEDVPGKKSFREAETWILEQNSDWVFSFQNICETLALNPDYVRRGLMEWKERHLGRVARARQVPKRRYGRNVAHLTT
ncbi:MAG: hypothetical protein WCH75_09260 [Candidatus Binatia bacterium]|jgi:hypothetical protein